MTKFINTVGGRRGRLDIIPDLNIFQNKRCRRGSEVFGKFLEDHDDEVNLIILDEMSEWNFGIGKLEVSRKLKCYFLYFSNFSKSCTSDGL